MGFAPYNKGCEKIEKGKRREGGKGEREEEVVQGRGREKEKREREKGGKEKRVDT